MVSYIVAVWVILQIAEVVFEPLGLPESGLRFIIVGGIAAVPVVFFLAWAIDIRQQGFIFDLPLWTNGTLPQREPRKADLALALSIGVLVIGSSGFFALYLNKEMPAPEPEVAPVIAAQQPQNSIAVMAFRKLWQQSRFRLFCRGIGGRNSKSSRVYERV